MTPKELINYEYEIMKHEIERGCPESRLCDEIECHPEYEEKIIEEAKNHSQLSEDLCDREKRVKMEAGSQPTLPRPPADNTHQQESVSFSNIETPLFHHHTSCWWDYAPRLRWHGNDGGYLI